MSFPNLLTMFGIGGNKAQTGAAGGAQMKPYQQLTAEELQSWQGYDPNIQKSRATQYANAYNQQQQPGAQPPVAQTPAPQAANPQQGKSIWDKLSDWNTGYNQRLSDRGLMNPVFQEQKNPIDKPFSVQDINEESWHNKADQILVDPNDPDAEKKLIDLSRDENGNLNPEKYAEVKKHFEDTKNNPAYQQAMDDVEQGYRDKYNNSLFSTINKYAPNPFMQLMERSGANQWLYGKAKGLGDWLSGSTPMSPKG